MSAGNARPPLVVAVVLNHNRSADTVACLGSLARVVYPRLEVIVLDAVSTDGSVATIRAAFPGVPVHELRENRGYAGNNDVGIDLALARGAEWILLLNEDVVVAPDLLKELLAAVATDPSAGVVGPMVYHADEPEVIQSAGGWLDRRWAARHRGQNERDTGQYAEPCRVDWLSGCALLIRSSALAEMGSLDERFFYYWEDVDLCLKVSGSGRSIVHAPRARVWHSGVTRDYRPSPSVVYYDTRNHLLLLAKHRAPLRVKVANGARIAWTLATWALPPHRAPLREHRRAMFRGARDFLRARFGRMPPS